MSILGRASANRDGPAAAALRESEVRYRRLFETARDGILILDAQTGQITEVNPFLCELLGYSRAELLGKELWEIGVFEDEAASRAAFEHLQQTGYDRHEDLPLKTRGKGRVEVEFVSNVYQAGEKTVIQCNIRDITDRVRMQREINRQAAELADAYRRKDEFLAMVSHELRNPLAPILNSVYILRLQGGENALQREARAMIERQTAHLARIVDDLLEISRIATGRIHLRLATVELNSIVNRAIAVSRPLIESRHHRISVSLCEAPIWLSADPVRLEQVLVNLLNNAAKYTGQGGQIWLTVRRFEAEVKIRVKDTGAGIEPAMLPRIFDLFTQAERSLDRAQGGLGIGLALVRSLVELHRGSVTAISGGLGTGSEFIVCLPLVPLPMQVADQGPPSVTERAPQGSRVLVVDDNMDLADSIATLLRLAGYEVRTAGTGPAGLEAARTYRPHVVLLDIGLPEMDGFEVARRIRQEHELKDIQLVALTGYGEEHHQRASSEAGFNQHLVKPVEAKRLLAILAELVPRRDAVPVQVPAPSLVRR
ncbi:MAG TPA: ATP-binding protein [Pirellulales bacterium]|nr:ATP-binding protein [Pirellulales bacterium]